jgi:hypothetical protein
VSSDLSVLATYYVLGSTSTCRVDAAAKLGQAQPVMTMAFPSQPVRELSLHVLVRPVGLLAFLTGDVPVPNSPCFVGALVSRRWVSVKTEPVFFLFGSQRAWRCAFCQNCCSVLGEGTGQFEGWFQVREVFRSFQLLAALLRTLASR